MYWIYFLHSGVLTKLHALSLTKRCPEFTVLIVYFLSFRIFEQLKLSLKNGVALEFFTVLKYFLSFRIFEQLALALKNRVAPKCFAVWNILFTFRIFELFACACPEKQSCPDIFHCIWTCIFYHSGFLSNFRFPWKTELPRNLWLYGIYFLHSEFLSNLRLPWKTEGPLNLLYRIYIFYYSGGLSNLRLPWKNRVALEFFTVLNILFTIQDFGATCSCPGIFHCTEIYFIIQDFLLYRIYIFYYSGVLSNLRLPCKQSLPWNFSSPGERQPPDPPPRTPMPIVDTFFLVKLTRNCSSWFN